MSGQQCGTIGRTSDSHGSNSEDNEFYINIGDPADCDGQITSISYCFYDPPQTENEYVATLAVYRLQGQGGRVYANVSSTIILRKTQAEVQAELGSNNFVCSQLTLDQPIAIQSNDVLGACVVNPQADGNTYRLDLVGKRGDVDSDLLRAEIAPASCTDTSTPANIDFDILDQMGQDVTTSRALHLHANIGNVLYMQV